MTQIFKFFIFFSPNPWQMILFSNFTEKEKKTNKDNFACHPFLHLPYILAQPFCFSTNTVSAGSRRRSPASSRANNFLEVLSPRLSFFSVFTGTGFFFPFWRPGSSFSALNMYFYFLGEGGLQLVFQNPSEHSLLSHCQTFQVSGHHPQPSSTALQCDLLSLKLFLKTISGGLLNSVFTLFLFAKSQKPQEF